MKKILAIVFIAAIVTGCNKTDSGDKKAELEKLRKEQSALTLKIRDLEAQVAKEGGEGNGKIRFIEVDTIQKGAFTHYLEIQGHVEAEENVTLSAQSMGVVTAVNVSEGSQVKKGQILAVIDDRIVLKSIDELKGQYDLAVTLYNKQKNLWDQKIGTEVQYLTSKTNKESLEHTLARLNEQLELTRIKSPINGTVDEVNLKVGQTPNPAEPAIRVVNSQNLKAKADVAESYLSSINTGDEVTVSFPDLKKDVKSKVSFAGKAINRVSRTFDVEVKLGSEKDFRPNMLAIMKIIDYKASNVITVPMNVIQNDESGKYVYVAVSENGKLVTKKRAIEVGMIYRGSAEVKSGLNNGEMVIVTGYQDLNEGDIVKL